MPEDSLSNIIGKMMRSSEEASTYVKLLFRIEGLPRAKSP
jgi:hypothetical protein